MPVYFVRQPNASHIKMGYAVNLESRLMTLQTANPEKLIVIGVIEDGTRKLERALHEYFADYRVNGEWFIENEELDCLIQECERLGWYTESIPERMRKTVSFGGNFREREQFKRKKERWIKRLKAMPRPERRALLTAIEDEFAEEESGKHRWK